MKTTIAIILAIIIALLAAGCGSTSRPQQGGTSGWMLGVGTTLNQGENPQTPSRQVTTRTEQQVAPVVVVTPDGRAVVATQADGAVVASVSNLSETTDTTLGSAQDQAGIIRAAQAHWKRIALSFLALVYIGCGVWSWIAGWRPVLPLLFGGGAVFLLFTASVAVAVAVPVGAVVVFFLHETLEAKFRLMTSVGGLRSNQ